MWTEIILPLQPLPKTLMSKLWIGKLYAGLSIFCLPTDSKKKKKSLKPSGTFPWVLTNSAQT